MSDRDDDLHTFACVEYAAKTRRSFCIAPCADARRERAKKQTAMRASDLLRAHGLARSLCVLARPAGTDRHDCAIELRDLLGDMLDDSDHRSESSKCIPVDDWGCEARKKLGVARGALDEIANQHSHDYESESPRIIARKAFEATAMPTRCSKPDSLPCSHVAVRKQDVCADCGVWLEEDGMGDYREAGRG